MQMRRNCLFTVMLLVMAAWGMRVNAQPARGTDALALAQKETVKYLAKLSDLHCTEIVTQQKLNPKGRVDETERSQFDYLIMMSGNSNEFQLNESRFEAPSSKHKVNATPLLTSNGISTLMLVFHPYYRDAFSFRTEPEEMIGSQATIPIHFVHISGHRTPAALALRGREFPLEIQGTAWLDEASGEVIRLDAGLMGSMSDVGLRSLQVHVEYKPETVGKETWMLPAKAVVDVATPRQHWRNTHIFENYKSFSTDAEQDPNYKVHPDVPAEVSPEANKPNEKEQQ
jgi:hypothetical protein